jgi:hypothetical protein
MPIIQNTARKQGNINPNPFKKHVSNRVFGHRGQTGVNVGGVANPGNPINLSNSGVDYNSRISHTGGNTNPVGSHSDTATIQMLPSLVPNGLTDLVPITQAVDVSPNEKGSFFRHITSKTASMRVSGGVDPNANTPFHPKMLAKSTKPKLYPQQAGERTSASSFASGATLVGDKHQDIGGRWNRIKRGAADSQVMHHGTLSSPTNTGINVGSGTSGSTSTGSYSNPGVVVNNNAHPTPNVVPWVPNKRGVQPNEKGTTFPVKLGCKQGCK